MVAYFKKQNYLFMLVGAVTGLLISVFLLQDWISSFSGIAKYIYMAFPVFAGIAVGRIISARWASRRLALLSDLLYKQVDLDGFLKIYEPMTERIPHNIVDYVDGISKIAYAYEAKGDYDQALKLISEVRTEDFQIHKLVATSLIAVQKTRLYLLKNDIENSAVCLSDLKFLRDSCQKRAPQLQKNIDVCIDLYSKWKAAICGEETDIAYLEEEEKLATNPIHKGEILLLLAKLSEKRGEKDSATAYYHQAASLNDTLFTTNEAKQKLSELSGMS